MKREKDSEPQEREEMLQHRRVLEVLTAGEPSLSCAFASY